MKKIAFLVPVLLVGCVTAYAGEQHAHWAYTGEDGPSHWSNLDNGFASCTLGKEQSPIDIQTKAVEKASLSPIKPSYKASAAELVNNGHTIQINLTDGGSAALSNGTYKLLQFHFHTPSEEKIDGNNAPLVAHLVHKNEQGNLAVVAVLFKEGKENAALKNVFSQLLDKEGKQELKGGFDVSTLLPKSLPYYSFKGSLTTPPCSEGVSWHVLKQPVEISAQQIAAFKKIFEMNARPVQPLNDRKVQESD